MLLCFAQSTDASDGDDARPAIQAVYDGTPCVLKRFDVHNERERSLFTNESKKLRALAHPCVVELQAAFFASNALSMHDAFGYIQLPFYKDGDLGQWLQSKRKIRSATAINRRYRYSVRQMPFYANS